MSLKAELPLRFCPHALPDPLRIPNIGSFWPAYYGSKFHFCNKKKKKDPPGIITFAQIPGVIRAVAAFPHAPMAVKPLR